MARITKAELEQQVAALQAQVEQLNRQIAELEAINNMKRERAPQPVRVPRAAYVAPGWQAERAAQMAAARELAMRIGRSVKVS